MQDELRDGDDGSLACGLLFGLASSEPGAGEELGDPVGRPVGGDLVDDVDEVDVGVDAGEPAVEQNGEQVRVALACLEAADEQRVLPERGYDAEQPLDMGVGDGEPAVVEEGAQGRLLPGPAVDGLAERAFLSTLAVMSMITRSSSCHKGTDSACRSARRPVASRLRSVASRSTARGRCLCLNLRVPPRTMARP
jgi:hypothetical protein